MTTSQFALTNRSFDALAAFMSGDSYTLKDLEKITQLPSATLSAELTRLARTGDLMVEVMPRKGSGSKKYHRYTITAIGRATYADRERIKAELPANKKASQRRERLATVLAAIQRNQDKRVVTFKFLESLLQQSNCFMRNTLSALRADKLATYSKADGWAVTPRGAAYVEQNGGDALLDARLAAIGSGVQKQSAVAEAGWRFEDFGNDALSVARREWFSAPVPCGLGVRV